MAGPSLGTNMHALVDWSTAFPFIDHFRMSRSWYTQSATEFDTGDAAMLDLDSRGWLRGFTADGSPAPFDRVATILFTGEDALPGVYVLDWQGAGDVSLDFLPPGAILTQADHRITFRFEGDQGLQISIGSTDPEGIGNYIRNIRLYNRDDADLLQAGEVFAPEFLQKISGFRVLRFMDWMATNNAEIHDWEDRRPAGYARETDDGVLQRGASVETMVRLANETRADPWFTLPHTASNDYIRRFATYVRDHLDEGLVARFEFSNEVWNWGFDQAHYALDRAEALWGADAQGGWMQWYGMRAARMAEIVAEVFGDETGSRALNVFATQSGWQGLEHYALDAPDLVAAGGTAPKDAPFHIYAIAPYFGGSLGSEEMAAQVDAWVAAGESGFRAALDYLRRGDGVDTLARIGDQIAYHAGVAASLGWQLEGYEGGQHVVDLAGLFGGGTDPAQSAFFIELVQRAEFRQLYADYFAIWRANGGGLMAQFSDFGAGSEYGSWGIWNSSHAENSPRAEAVLDFRDGVAAWWADDRTAGTFDNGLSWVDRDATDLATGTAYDDLLIGLGGDNHLTGKGGNDLLTGLRGQDRLFGGSGNDRLLGRGGADDLRGGPGRDEIYGGLRGDRIEGGAGRDLLSGGHGADTFVFSNPGPSAPSAPDLILDFTRGQDRIDLSGLIAGAAIWRGDGSFTGSGTTELRYLAEAAALRLEIDLDGNGVADVAILLQGLQRLWLGDLIL